MAAPRAAAGEGAAATARGAHDLGAADGADPRAEAARLLGAFLGRQRRHHGGGSVGQLLDERIRTAITRVMDHHMTIDVTRTQVCQEAVVRSMRIDAERGDRSAADRSARAAAPGALRRRSDHVIAPRRRHGHDASATTPETSNAPVRLGYRR